MQTLFTFDGTSLMCYADITMKGMLKKFVSYYKPHKALFFWDTFCSILVAGINLLYPTIARNIINQYVPQHNLRLIAIWSAVLLGIYILKAGLNYFIQYWGHVMGVRIQSDMRRDFFRHVQRLPFSYFDENKTGTIMSRIINDLFEVAELAHHGPEEVLISSFTLIGSLVMVFLINPYLGFIILIILPFMFWFAIKQRSRLTRTFTETRKETGEINAEVESSISGIRVSRAYTATEHELNKFDASNGRFVAARTRAYKAMGIFGSGMGFFTDLLYLVALVFGGLLLYFSETGQGGFLLYFGKIESGDYAGFILYISTIISPIRTLTTIFESIQGGMTGFKRFQEIMHVASESDSPDAVDVDRLDGDIHFEHVSFRYDSNVKGDELVLKDIDFVIPQGKTVALVGPSGGGKTTLCHLIPRFYDVQDGRITIGGMDTTHISRYSLRRNVGIVAQDVFLFGGTVKENIAYGNFDATDEEIIEAAKKANIHDYIMTLPDGYQTQVGERGVKLSGGQKQRISIARVFLKNPPILILDEATSALDNVTEAMIQQSLEKLSEGRTTIVVAHRLSTIENADEILVLTSKGIEERGTHKQLLEQNGIYAGLYNHLYMLQK